MSGKKCIILLGSTGSIGNATLDVIARHAQRFKVVALAARRNVDLLVQQARRFRPAAIAVADAQAAQALRDRLRKLKIKTQVLAGDSGVRRAAVWPTGQQVVSAMVGTAGLLPTLDAIAAGKDIALANKETLVMAGDLVMAAVRRRGVRLLPVDSEHAALAQCLRGHAGIAIRRLILTASGGPFVHAPASKLKRVTVADALKHPTWSMGRKITVDSSTLMNKGLEVIEAHHLFGVPFDRIEVVVHPQSIIHSLVEFVDGSVLGHLSSPDMRLPIQNALTDPEKLRSLIQPLDFQSGLNLNFESPDVKRFPCLSLAYRAGGQGGTAPAVLNAANEVAVQAFLEQRLDFMGIPRVIAAVLSRHRRDSRLSLPAILAADAWARSQAVDAINAKPRP